MSLPEQASVAIIGAGPAGLTVAHELLQRGIRADVYEAAETTGGLARSPELWGMKVDLGPHAFYSNSYPEVLEFAQDKTGDAVEITLPQKAVLYKGKLIAYPFRPFELLGAAGLFPFSRFVWTYFTRKKISAEHCRDAATLIHSRFGAGLYEAFFEPFCKKYLGLPPEEVDVDFARSLFNIREDISLRKKTSELPVFIHPVGGTGAVWETVTERLKKNGVNIFTSTKVKQLLVRGKKISGLELPDGTVRVYETVISTIPLVRVLALLPEAPDVAAAAQALQNRHTILVYVNVDRIIGPQHYITSYTNEFRFGRITNYRNWLPQQWKNRNDSILSVEYWCDDASPEWKMSDEAVIALTKEELQRAGICTPGDIRDCQIIRLPQSYPVLSNQYKEKLAPVQHYLSTFEGLEVLGRHGNFKWDGQEDNIRAGIVLAKKIAAERQ